jgi:hypothetical protein
LAVLGEPLGASRTSCRAKLFADPWIVDLADDLDETVDADVVRVAPARP